jgi:N-acyl-D-aspartate/D-glutamate deacylase
MDGVTTALELEVGASPVNKWYSERESKALVNFGASAGPIPARMAVMGDTSNFVPRDAALNGTATPEQQAAILAAVQKDLDDGGLGVGLGIEMAPKMSPPEVLDLFNAVAKWRRPIFIHLRKPGAHVIESLQEVIADAAVAGVSIHVMHISGTAGFRTPEALRMVEGARARGLDVTVEVYPYIAGSAPIESGLFDPGWQENRGITYSDLMWVATGERLTEESFGRYRKQGGRIIMFLNTEDTVRKAVAHPLTMVASDGLLTHGQGHPRGAGTYARILGKYVREERALSLMEAIRKCSLMPAQRLEPFAPQMRNKGRIKVGGDADLTVFDPVQVIDKATFENPGQFSEGFRYVFVNGRLVVRNGKLESGVFPGEAIRAPAVVN